MRVFVYWNLHRSCWSIKALQGPQRGRVIGHAREAELADCEFRVSEAGRRRVIREQRKNVHAGVAGTLCQWHAPGSEGRILAPHEGHGAVPREAVEQITYNPYKAPTFVSMNYVDRPPVRRASSVVMRGREVLAVRPSAA